MDIGDNSNLNPHVEVTVNRPIKIIHFSDGIQEDFEEKEVNEVQSVPQTEHVDPKSLSWGPWFSYYTWKSGTKVLNAVDYAGETLAGFFGITTPKYQIEMNEYERLQEEKKKLDNESAGWVPRNGGGDIPLVMSEPVNNIDKPAFN